MTTSFVAFTAFSRPIQFSIGMSGAPFAASAANAAKAVTHNIMHLISHLSLSVLLSPMVHGPSHLRHRTAWPRNALKDVCAYGFPL